MIHSPFTMLLLSALAIGDSTATLTVEETRLVRENVYDQPARLGSLAIGDPQALLIPEALVKLHGEKPQAVIDLLLVIMDGGNPKDSALAPGYALSFIDNTRVGAMVVRNSQAKTYDAVDKNWGKTPRLHWICQVVKR